METIIKKFNDALELRSELSTLQMKGYHLFYRGHACNNFKLLSMVGRKSPINGDLLDSEMRCFQDYKNLIAGNNWTQYMVPSYNVDLFYMSIGRHLHLDCRLLDWTARMETALFFASAENDFLSKNGHLWIMMYKGDIVDTPSTVSPFNIKEVTLLKECYYIPNDHSIYDLPLGEQRRFAQNGFFTIAPSNLLTTPLDSIHMNNIKLIKVEITANAKIEILNKLPSSYSNFIYKGNSELKKEILQINSKYFE